MLLNVLARQTLTDFEVVVVVDGDIDDTAGMLGRDYPHVQVIVFPENRGRAAALSAGFAAARGEILIRSDDDLEPRRDFVASHVAAHADGPGGAIGMCANVYLNNNPYSRSYGVDRDVLLRKAAVAADPAVNWRYWGGNVSVPRDVYAQIGEYDTDYVGYGYEDTDWGWRLHEAGFPIVVRPELEVLHHGAAVTAEIRTQRAFASGMARHLFESKHPAAASAVRERSPWDDLVGVTAWRAGVGRSLALARFADATVGVLPHPVAHKVVALSVEAAGKAGFATAKRRADADPAATGSVRTADEPSRSRR